MLDLLNAGADPNSKNSNGKTFAQNLRFDFTQEWKDTEERRRLIAWLQDHDIPVRPQQSGGEAPGRVLAVGHVCRGGDWLPSFVLDLKDFGQPREFVAAVEAVQNELDEFGIPLRFDQRKYPLTDRVFQLPAWEAFRRQLTMGSE